MSVYFVRLGRYIKVGYSDTPEQRFRRLFAGSTSYSAPWDCPRSIAERTLLGYVSGSKTAEWMAHEVLSEFGVGGEFYLAEPPVLEYVESCLNAGQVLIPGIPRAEGSASFVGQVPPGSDVRTLSDITAARKQAAS